MRAKLSAPGPPEERSAIWWFRWIPTVVLTVLILYSLYVLGSVALVPVLASFALAYLLNPVVSQGEKYGLSRPIATALALLLLEVSPRTLHGLFITPETSLQPKLQVRFWRNVWPTLPKQCSLNRSGLKVVTNFIAPDKKGDDPIALEQPS